MVVEAEAEAVSETATNPDIRQDYPTSTTFGKVVLVCYNKNMWKHWTNGVLGLWIIIMPYLGFTNGVHQMLMVISGVAIAVLAFWSASELV